MPNKTSDFFIKLNPLIKPLMNSPLHFLLSSRVMLMRFTGRKSGKQFVTPVAYTDFGDCIIITLTESANRNWWRNYRDPWPMDIKRKGQWQSGEAQLIVEGSGDYFLWFEKIFNRDGFMPRIFKIHDYDRKAGLSQSQRDILLENTSAIVRFVAH